MSCDLLKVHALIDEQLEEAEAREVRNHLAECNACKAEYLAVNSVKSVLADKCEKVETKESWAKCQKRLKELDRSSKVESFVGRYSWAMCAVLFLVIVSGSVTNHIFGKNRVHSGEVANMMSNISTLSEFKPTSWFDSQNWLKETFGKAPTKKQPEGMRILSMARGNDKGRMFAQIRMADGKGVLKFIVIEAEGYDGATRLDGRSPYFVGQINLVNSIAWSDGRFTFILAGDRPSDELAALADKIYVR